MDLTAQDSRFVDGAMKIVQRVVLAQQYWSYFRDKFEMRDLAEVQDALLSRGHGRLRLLPARSKSGQDAEALKEGDFREPPADVLPCAAETSPPTWLRSQAPPGRIRGVRVTGRPLTLPSLAELCRGANGEPVGASGAAPRGVHDLERDLGLEPVLKTSFRGCTDRGRGRGGARQGVGQARARDLRGPRRPATRRADVRRRAGLVSSCSRTRW